MAHPYHASVHTSAFQMPSYTSHTSRSGSGAANSPGRSKKSFSNGDFSAASTALSPGKPSSRFMQTAAPKSNHLDSDQSLLEMLSSTVACLKQKHMDLEALGCLEQSLWLKRRMFGVDNSVVQRALNEVVLSYNSVAMQYLAQAQFDQCLAMLRKAEAITAPGNFKKCQSLQILTFNNIGCCYRKLGKLKSALKYLKEAAQIGSTCAHVKNLSITHLNLCAIQSQLGRHDLALEHAQAAIFHTQEELVSMEAQSSSGSRDEDDENSEIGGDSSSSSSDVLDAKSREEKIISLAVAYHNLAVELEFNGRGDASLQWYKKALQLVWKYRESNSALCASFKKIFMDAKKKLELQRAGGHSSASMGGRGSSRANAQSNSRVPASAMARSSNAFSGGDRRKPIARPKSAHHASSSRTGGGGVSDLSYSANVASQCYKPTKPSTAGLQYASPPKGGDRASAGSRRGVGASQSSKPAPRCSSATGGSRPRPMSASGARSKRGGGAAADDDDADLLGPSIEAHWKRLEKEFAIENTSAASTTSSNNNHERHGAQQQQQSRAAPVKRPQSARPTTHSSRVEQPQRSNRNQFDERNDDLCGIDDDDDDYGVLDDDEPSDIDDDDLGDPDKSDTFAELLLRSDEKHPQQLNASRGSQVRSDAEKNPSRTGAENGGEDVQQLSGRGHRHRQALDEARRKSQLGTRVSEPAVSDTSSLGSMPPSPLCGGDDESDLPNQRVSHMEYLRRMKRLAENIKDDLTGASAPEAAVVAKPGSGAASQQRKMPPRPTPVATASPSVKMNDKDAEALTIVTPRGSTSKVRERLERVRSESFHNLPTFSDDAALSDSKASVDEDAVRSQTPEADSFRESQQQFVEIVEDTTHYCASERDAVVAEQKLIRAAAAKHIQAFLRGERARAHARAQRQHLRESEAALLAQERTTLVEQQAKEKRLRDEEEMLARAHQLEIENLAASTIQQLYKDKCHLSGDSRGSISQSTANLTSVASPSAEGTTRQARRQSEPVAISENAGSALRAPDSTQRRQDSAAVVIQATMKGFVTREVVAEHRAAQLSRLYVEHKHMEVALHHAMTREQEFLEHLSATKIQALVRGRQSRLLTDATIIGHHTAAEKIQSSFRSHRRHLLRSRDIGVRSVAVRLIQRLARSYLLRQHSVHEAVISEELSEVQHIAAASLQKFWRRVAAKRELLLEELEAATCIQALGRGHLVRKSLQSLRDSSSQVGLSKQPSAFPIAAVTGVEQLLEEADDPQQQHEYEDEFDAAKRTGSSRQALNLGFLPALVREMYAVFVDAPSYTEARAAADELQQNTADTDRDEVEDLGLTLDDLMLELETCSDVATACFALKALRTLVLLEPETHCTLPNAIKAAQAIDQRIQDHEVWTQDVQLASLWLLDVFRDLLCAGV